MESLWKEHLQNESLQRNIFKRNLFKRNFFKKNLYKSSLLKRNLYKSNLFKRNLFKTNLFKTKTQIRIQIFLDPHYIMQASALMIFDQIIVIVIINSTLQGKFKAWIWRTACATLDDYGWHKEISIKPSSFIMFIL